ncbi:MAG: spore cortex-lytic enzyme [Hyphomonadaceae bacterium]|nr:spore cortex-lytic enzyme [Clostridia bacterium]
MRLRFTIVLTAILLVLIALKLPILQSTLSELGSNGEEVKQIQNKLKAWGYYNDDIDGIYGRLTENGVKYFQRKNGLAQDGVAGPKTLAALGLNPNTAGAPSGYGSGDRDLLARVINAEARGEPYIGQVAVGAVILNRVRHPSFPKTIPSVIYQPGAFTAVDDGQIHANMTATAYKAAVDALNGWDPTYGCIYYFNPNTATSAWIWSRPAVLTIGEHIFTK